MRGNRQAFTIVEMVVVVVVIAILAAISVMSYGAITRNAHITTLKADLTASSSAIIKSMHEVGAYPATASAADALLHRSDGVRIDYLYDSEEKTFCLDGSFENEEYFITPDRVEAQEGSCSDIDFVEV